MGELRAVILVPRRDDNGPRDALWEWTRAWWEAKQSHMPIIEGYHVDGLFNRSAAVNRAARLAGDWDVAVIIDADVVCNPERVRKAVQIANETGMMVLPHTVRKDLSPTGSTKVRRGFDGSWDRFVAREYSVENGHPSVSSVVVVPRRLWDEVGGFDEQFRGWGYEDTAFAAACQTFGGDIVRMDGEVWHLWHPTAREGKRGTTSWSLNAARGQRYRAAIGDPDAIRALQGSRVEGLPPTTIPRILHRTVPAVTDPVVEDYWNRWMDLHPEWEYRTWRDPLDPADFPLTSEFWRHAENGAQLADMVRLEVLVTHGGVYVDSDVEPLRRLDSLTSVPAFAAYEDERCIPNAVLGAAAGHPAIRACLDLMLSRIPGPTWEAGPGVTTEVLPTYPDVLLLPPGSFYPYHYREKHRARENFRKTQPWAFAVHHWAGSWLAPSPIQSRDSSVAHVSTVHPIVIR